MKIYKPYPGKGASYGTVFLILLLAIMTVPLIQIWRSTGNLGAVLPVGILVLFLLGIFGYFIYTAATLRYIIDGKDLIIKWAFSQKKIDLESINGIEKRIGISAFKVAGASWPGLHIGAFAVGDNNNVNLYATRITGDLILLKHKWETVGITPEDPDLFLKDLSDLVPGIESKSVDPKVVEENKKESVRKNAKTFNILTAVNAVLIGLTFLWVTLVIPRLPAKIPMHIGPSGVDRYGVPQELYVMPVITIAVFIGMYLLARYYRGNPMASYILLGGAIFTTVIMNLAIVSLLSL